MAKVSHAVGKSKAFDKSNHEKENNKTPFEMLFAELLHGHYPVLQAVCHVKKAEAFFRAVIEHKVGRFLPSR